MKENPEFYDTEGPAEDEPSEEELAEKKRQNRINALILGAVFIIVTLAPQPLKNYAPLLFVIPLLYAILSKIRRKAGTDVSSNGGSVSYKMDAPSAARDPYESKPRDSEDPRRYKPIG